jgi:hypothetical protein
MTVSSTSLRGLALGATSILAGAFAIPAQAADWSTTEIHYQYGKLDSPFAGGSADTHIVTLQHASGYSFGDIFFFVDLLDDDVADNFNDKDAYGELYAAFSAGKIAGAKFGGPIKDAGFVMGINYGADANVLKYLPGAYLDWNVPGFAFLRTQVTAYIDDSDGIAAESDSWQFDVAWAYPFMAAGQRFSIEGHVEYTGERDGVFGKVNDWVLAQPQFRWDVGYALTGKADQFFIGTEYQFWANKLGTDVDESAFQALGVWRF